MSLNRYLSASFENPDPEFIEGEVVERNGGSWAHSRAMGELVFRLAEQDTQTGLYALLSIRLRTAENRVRVADVAAFLREPGEEVPSTPPLVVAEITSPEDAFCFLIQKLEEYRQWGVRHIWIADPEDRKFLTYGADGLHEVNELTLPEHAIILRKEDIFGA